MGWTKKKDRTMVINFKRDPIFGFVYIGRDFRDPKGRGKWGNPFKIGEDGDRDEVIEKYRTWIKEPDRKPLYDLIIPELKGEVLGCYCKPYACHGDVLAAIANGDER